MRLGVPSGLRAFTPPITAMVCASTSLWRWIGSCSSRMAPISGKNWSISPVSTKNHNPTAGSSTTMSLSNSSRMRSADTMDSRSRNSTTAAVNSSTGFNP